MKVTNNAGVEPAMEWLLAHADEELPVQLSINSSSSTELKTQANTSAENDEATVANDANAVVVAAASGAASASGAAGVAENTDVENKNDTDNNGGDGGKAPVAKSLKCDECGKLFKNGMEAEFHAVRTKHCSYSESTDEKPPLTEEEKRQQLILLEEKLKLKRIEREERERRDELERERNRIKSGKDMTEARQRMEHLEMQKIVEQRKREKAEEKSARERVRAQIEADKAARKARQDRDNSNDGATEKSPTIGTTTITTTITTTTITSTKMSAGTSTNTYTNSNNIKKDYTHTRIQIRLQDGGTLTENFSVKEQLSAIRVFIQVKTGSIDPFGLMTTFPRKVFTDEDYEKPLDALGLVPSAVVIMTKVNNHDA